MTHDSMHSNNKKDDQLTALAKVSRLVADTGDLSAIEQFKPTDATTNPSLLLKAAQDPQYNHLIDQLIQDCPKQITSPEHQATYLCDQLAIMIGKHILEKIEGRVSTEVDAMLSFDTNATVNKARQLIQGYRQNNADTERVLIKIAGTWEGLEAARILSAEGIHCNVTLIFNLLQAAKAAEANVYLISPFIGRILDWHKKHRDFNSANPMDDPGVQSVHQIYHYLKQHDKKTLVMGASFRNIGEIQALAGCDALTISPALLTELTNSNDPLPTILPNPEHPTQAPLELSETAFRWALNQDPAASFLLNQGIRQFHNDYLALKKLILEKCLK